jgi:phage N-6-adenine-methyltransferase
MYHGKSKLSTLQREACRIITISMWKNSTDTSSNSDGTRKTRMEQLALIDCGVTIEPQQNWEWYTPREIIEAARSFFGRIDLDPASSDLAQTAVCANKYYTLRDNGLTQPWAGRIWLNPPFTRGVIEAFVDKLIVELDDKVDQALVLTHNCTETEWWQKLADRAAAIAFPAKRLRFWGPLREADNNPRGQTIFYLANRSLRLCGKLRFASYFKPFGFVSMGRNWP